MRSLPVTMYGLVEPHPGPVWRGLFEVTWPAYRRWYLQHGHAARPDPMQAAAAMAHHLPELLPVWAELARETGFDDTAAVMLTQWKMPAFAPAACSQLVVDDGGPVLVRNYDYDPGLLEWVSLSTNWLKPVIGTSDCLWGLLDGMNGDGLVVSLTYGGDATVVDGFAIPLVVRYVLETCATTEQARAVVARLPIAMSYNLTMVDAQGDIATVHLRPGHAAEFSRQPLATNHRWRAPVDPDHARRFRSIERYDRLDTLQADRTSVVVDAMLDDPLYSTDYAAGFGTLYTAAYRPVRSELTYHWPGKSWRRGFDSPPGSCDLVLDGS